MERRSPGGRGIKTRPVPDDNIEADSLLWFLPASKPRGYVGMRLGWYQAQDLGAAQNAALVM